MSLLQQRDDEDAMERADDIADATPISVGDPIATAAAGSVLYSWFKFYVKGDKVNGLFVGLWAPTLLAAASYLQQKDIIEKFKRSLSSF